VKNTATYRENYDNRYRRFRGIPGRFLIGARRGVTAGEIEKPAD